MSELENPGTMANRLRVDSEGKPFEPRSLEETDRWSTAKKMATKPHLTVCPK